MKRICDRVDERGSVPAIDHARGRFVRATHATYGGQAPESPSITFTSDGRFVDRGIFKVKELLPAAGTSPSSPAPGEGKGRYSIRNYTLILSYENGVAKRISFLKVADDNPTAKVQSFFVNLVAFRPRE